MSDVNDKSASQEAVKNLDTTTSEILVNSTNTESIGNEKDNLLKALHQERSERKELKKRLEDFENSEKARKEKELAEQGRFKELLESKEIESKTIKDQLDNLSKEVEKYREGETKKLETMKAQAKEKLNQVQFATIEKLLVGKSISEQMELLPEIMNSIIPQNTNSLPNNNATITTKDNGEYQSVLKNGDILGALNLRKYP